MTLRGTGKCRWFPLPFSHQSVMKIDLDPNKEVLKTNPTHWRAGRLSRPPPNLVSSALEEYMLGQLQDYGYTVVQDL